MSSRPRSGFRDVYEWFASSAKGAAESVAATAVNSVGELTGESARLRQQLLDDWQALQPTLASADGVTPIRTAYEQSKTAYVDARAGFERLRAGNDPRPALAALALLKTKAEPAAALRAEHDQQHQTMRACADWEGAHAAALKPALAATGLHAALLGAHGQLTTAHEAFHTALDQRDYLAASALRQPVLDALAAFQLAQAEHERLAAARKSIDSWQAKHSAELAQALLLEQVSPEVRARLRLLRPLQQQYDAHRRADEPVEAEQCQAALEKILGTLAGLKGDYDQALVEKKKTDGERAKLEARYRQVNNVAPLTPELAKLTGAFHNADAAFERRYYGGRYAEATAKLAALELAIAGLEGAAADIAVATQQEAKARADWNQALQALDSSDGLPNDSLEVVALRKDVQLLIKRRNAEYADKQFGKAITSAADLLAKARELDAEAKKHDSVTAARDKMAKAWALMLQRVGQARRLQALTPDIKRDLAEMERLGNQFVAEFKGRDNAAAEKTLPAVGAAVDVVMKGKQAHDAAADKFRQAGEMLNGLKATFEQARKRQPYKGVDADVARLCAAWAKTMADYQAARAVPDADAALSAATLFPEIVDGLLAKDLAQLQLARDGTLKQITDGWKALEARFRAVQQFEPLNDELKQLLEQLNGRAAAFDKSGAEKRYADQLAELAAMTTSVEALEKIDYAKLAGEAHQVVIDDWVANVDADYQAALAVNDDTALLKTLLARLAGERDDIDKALRASKRVQARAAMQTLKATIAEVHQADADNQKALADFDAALQSLKAHYKEVKQFEPDFAHPLNDAIAALPKAREDAVDAFDAGDGVEAMRLLPDYRQLVDKLWNGKALYDDAVSCDGELAALDPAFSAALDLYNTGAPSPEFEPLIDAFGLAWDAFLEPFREGKIAQARPLLASGGALDLAARALASHVASVGDATVDQQKQERAAVLAEWANLAADFDAVSEWRALTPEIAKEQAELQRARAGFADALHKRCAFAEALASVQAGGELFVALKKLTDRDAEYQNLATQAEQAATQAAGDIDNTDAADLAKKSATAKVKLLEDLLAQKEDLPSKEEQERDPALKARAQQLRKRQIKVLATMGLDARFEQEDEKKKTELVRQLREDPDLTKARKDWNGKPALSTEARIAALRKVLARQCALYGMDVPPIKEFCDPGDKSGIENGYFSASTGAIFINTHPNSGLESFEQTLDLVVHENAHNFQFELMRRLEAGEIKPGEPMYDQALLFAANGDLYLRPGEAHELENSLDSYEAQPMEMHSFKIGPDVAKAFLKP